MALILVERTSSYFVFQTIKTPVSSTGSHPENGVRQFGFDRNPDGSVTFYTRGVSQNAIPALPDLGKSTQVKGWIAMMQGISVELLKRTRQSGGDYIPNHISAWDTELPTSYTDCPRPTANAGQDQTAHHEIQYFWMDL